MLYCPRFRTPAGKPFTEREPGAVASLRPILRANRRRLIRLTVLAVVLWLALPAVALINDGPSLGALARLAPRLGGLQKPITLLVLVQNEDELRGTGGYITAVGTLTIDKGRVTDMSIEDSFAVDDLTLFYPVPPDPLRLYMNAPLWLLRDVNWSANLPSVAPLAEAFYTATRPGAIDGVLTMDQAALRFMLQGTGPIRIEGYPGAIHAGNLVQVMRAAREPDPGEGISYEWWLRRKDFMPQIARALLRKVVWASWPRLADSAIRTLDERHVQIWLKDPEAAAILAERGWDGALRPAGGDYLMVTETNVGFNKVNAIREAAITYAVDLTDLVAPVGRVVATYTNPAEGQGPCVPGADYGDGRYLTLVNRCYWNYLRVFVPDTAELLDAVVPPVPREWLELPNAPTGSIDVWPEPNGLQSFGTLMVVPYGTQQATEVRYALGPEALTTEAGQTTYHLRLQKQAGIEVVAVTLSVALPTGGRLVSAAPRGRLMGTTWQVTLALRRDTDVRLVFQAP